jgi:hypothetical protein
MIDERGSGFIMRTVNNHPSIVPMSYVQCHDAPLLNENENGTHIKTTVLHNMSCKYWNKQKKKMNDKWKGCRWWGLTDMGAVSIRNTVVEP